MSHSNKSLATCAVLRFLELSTIWLLAFLLTTLWLFLFTSAIISWRLNRVLSASHCSKAHGKGASERIEQVQWLPHNYSTVGASLSVLCRLTWIRRNHCEEIAQSPSARLHLVSLYAALSLPPFRYDRGQAVPSLKALCNLAGKTKSPSEPDDQFVRRSRVGNTTNQFRLPCLTVWCLTRVHNSQAGRPWQRSAATWRSNFHCDSANTTPGRCYQAHRFSSDVLALMEQCTFPIHPEDCRPEPGDRGVAPAWTLARGLSRLLFSKHRLDMKELL